MCNTCMNTSLQQKINAPRGIHCIEKPHKALTCRVIKLLDPHLITQIKMHLVRAGNLITLLHRS